MGRDHPSGVHTDCARSQTAIYYICILIITSALIVFSTTVWSQTINSDSKVIADAIKNIRSDLAKQNLVVDNKLDALSGKLDTLHDDMQALLKALPSGATLPIVFAPVVSGASPVVTATSAADAIAAKYFPADPGLAEFPSPENSRMIRNPNGLLGGRSYLLDNTGAAHRFTTPTSDNPNGYTVNGVRPGNYGPETYNNALVRQGRVFVQRSTGQWQLFNPAMGAMYNAPLLDAFQTDASGKTTSVVATSSVSAPSPAARQRPAPGTSGRVLKVCASDCQFRTISAALGGAGAGDTISIGAGAYREAPPAWTIPLKIVFEPGAFLDLKGLTRSLARGKGALVPAADSIIVDPVITGTALDQSSAQGTAAIRPDQGCGYLDIQGGTLSGNQNGIAAGDVPVVLTVTGTKLDNNGLGDGYTHNIYMSHGTLSVTLTNVQSTNPNNGHAAKLRSFAVAINGGSYDAFSAAAIDIPDGTIAPGVINGATITKKAGAYNHTVLDYATEDTVNGNGGLILRNVVMNLLCDNPAILVGSGSSVTIEGSTKIVGTKPTAQGGTVKGL